MNINSKTTVPSILHSIWIVYWICFLLLCGCNNTSSNISNNVTNTVAQAQTAQKNTENILSRLSLIHVLDSLHQFNTTLAHIDSLIRKENPNGNFWFIKAQLLEHAGDTLKAIDNYVHAAAIEPSTKVLLALANMYAETRNRKIIEVCEQINNLHLGKPYNSYTLFFTGVYYARIGNSNKALQYFNECIANNFHLMDAYMEKGYLLYDEKKYEEALAVFSTAAAVNNNYDDAYYWQNKCYKAMGK